MVDADFNEPGQGAAPPKKGNLPAIIITAVIAVVIAASGGFFVGRMSSGGGAKSDQVMPTGTGTKPGGEIPGYNTPADFGPGTGTNTGEEKKQPGFLPLETFTVNLDDPFGRRYVECVLNLVLSDKSLVTPIKENELIMAKIRHDIFMTISAKSYKELKGTAGKITLFEEIQMRVNEILKELMGVEPVVEVLQTKFLMQ